VKLLSALLIITATAATAATSAPARNRHVVVISIDGFPAFSLRNQDVAVPHIRSLIAKGAAADRMTCVNPTVTWPNHTSMVSGVPPAKHNVLFNGAPVRGAEGEPVRVEPHVPKDQLVAGSTVYDAAVAAGLTTAEVDWVAVEKAPHITWRFAEWPSADGPIEREMIAAGLVTEDGVSTFTKRQIAWRDEIWTRAAEHIITRHKPNLLLFHLLTTDSIQHQYGPGTLAAHTALALADTRVGRIIEATRRAGIYDQTTFLIVSDHGFKTVKRLIRPNALLRQLGLSDRAWVISEGGTAMVYATRTADRAAIVQKIREPLSKLEGVSRVLTPDEFAAAGLPQPGPNARMADLLIAAADGYGFHGTPDGDAVVRVPEGSSPGSHGYLNSEPDMDAIFVASGAGIKPGVPLGTVKNVDVAPTIAHLLGISLAGVEGRPLTAALQ
jgi:predicted AlkP superfamily pyrophosphatase or phosphodiesterase